MPVSFVFPYNIDMTVENIKVFGFLDALRGMRNPLNSWVKNDSKCICDQNDGHIISLELGPNDTSLCNTLVHGGQPHRKFLRQIFVTMDITAPMYWWAEMDTYKVSTTRNSCSVQHKGASRDFNIGDFTFEDFNGDDQSLIEDRNQMQNDITTVIDIINRWRRKYVDGGKKNYSYFRAMRQFMSSAYNYKATWSANYEVLLNIYEWREKHLLKEWHTLCNEIEKLPAMDIFTKQIP